MADEIDPEITLDPENWQALAKLGDDVLEDMFDYLENVRERKVWQDIPENIKQCFNESPPMKPLSSKEVYERVKHEILPYPPGNIHPRFWGWVNGTGTPFGLISELIIAAMNANTGGREHIANYVERQLVSWMREIFEFPANSSGLVTSGCSIANLIGITVARNQALDFDVRKKGIMAIKKPMILYGTSQMHSSIQKAMEILGLGSDSIHLIECDENASISIDNLRAQIKQDIEANLQPFVVVGNVGTVNSGTIDDILALRKICDEFNLWLHLDGAFGALLQLSSNKYKIKGIELADSLAFDFHKWMHVNYDAGFVLIRDDKLHRDTFTLRPSYLASMERGLAGGGYWFSEYGLQLSRGFRSLKVWMTIKRFGFDIFGRLIDQNIRQARYFADIIEKQDNIELVAKVNMNIVCFRYNPGEIDEEELELINKKILYAMYDRGIVAPSYTRIFGKYCLRIAITNHRSRLSDLDILLNELNEIIELLQ